MGGKKKQTIGYQYFTGVHMVLGLGPWDSISRVRYGDKTAWSGLMSTGWFLITAPNLYGGESGEGGAAGVTYLLNGAADQEINPYLASKQGAYCPAYRGEQSLVFQDFYWGNVPSYKPVKVTGTRIHTADDGGAQWYDAKAEIIPETEQAPLSIAVDDTYEYQVLTERDDPGTTYLTPPTSGYSEGEGPFGQHNYGPALPETPATEWPSRTEIWVRKTVTLPAGHVLHVDVQAENGCVIVANGRQIGSINPENTDLTSLPETTATYGPFLASVQVTVAVKGFDERNLAPESSNTYLAVAISSQAGPRADMNPAHIIREVLISTRGGKGTPPARIDDSSFTAAADTLYTENFGLSFFWTGEQNADEFLQRVLDIIDAKLYISPRTGLYTLKLIRDDYTEGNLPILSERQIKRVEGYRRPQPQNLTNSVCVIYWDAKELSNASVQADDPAAIIEAGAINSITRDYSDGVTNWSLATRIAGRDLKTTGYPLLSAKLTCTQAAAGLLPGDAFLFDWPQLHDDPVVMRVQSLKRGGLLNRRIIVEALQDVFSIASSTSLTYAPPVWAPPSEGDIPRATAFAVEAPYYELVQRFGATRTDALLAESPDAGLVLATVKTEENAVNAYVYENDVLWSVDADMCPSGTLNTLALPGDSTLDITWTSAPEEGTHFQIDDELIRYDGLDSDGMTLAGRGVLDTVPAEHAVDAVCFAWDADAVTDEAEHADGEAVDITVALRNGSIVSDLSDPVTVTFASRASRPYPPGNVQINGAPYPESAGPADDLVITWSHRNRVTQGSTLVDTTEGTITPEAGTTYNLRIYDSVELGLLEETTGITGETHTYSPVVGDPDFASVMLLLHFDGADGSNTLTDSSGAARVVSAVGNAQIDTAQSVFGGASLLLDGTGDYLSIGTSTDFTFGAGDFTVEAWVRFAAVPGAGVAAAIFSRRDAANSNYSYFFYYLGGTGWVFSYSTSGTAGINATLSTATPSTGTWYHLALQRNGASVDLYIDGVKQTTYNIGTATLFASSAVIKIGASNLTAANFLNGWLDDFRVTKGVARYSANFTLPAEPYPDSYGVEGSGANGYLIELESERGGLTSWQVHSITVDVSS